MKLSTIGRSGKEKAYGRECYFLKKFMDELGAIDLGFKGYRFTWDNGYSGAVLIKNGLDCTIADRDLVNFYQAGCRKVTIKT